MEPILQGKILKLSSQGSRLPRLPTLPRLPRLPRLSRFPSLPWLYRLHRLHKLPRLPKLPKLKIRLFSADKQGDLVICVSCCLSHLHNNLSRYCRVRFRRSKPFSQGISRVISLTIKANIAGQDFESPNPFLKAFLESYSQQLGPKLQGEISKVKTLFSRAISRVIFLT